MAALIACALAAFYLSLSRGLWLDEFWTIAFARHDAPLAAKFHDLWAHDVHPPLYAFLMWLAAPLTGVDKLGVRLSNLMGLPIVGIALLIARRYATPATFLWLFVLLTAACPSAIVYFSEYRSCFLELCFATASVLLLHVLALLPREISLREDKGLILALLILVPIAANLHFVSAAGVLLFTGIALLDRFRARRFASAGLLTLVCFIGTAALLGSVLMIMAHGRSGGEVISNPVKGVMIVAAVTGASLLGNIVALVLAVRNGLLPDWRVRTPARDYALLLIVQLAVCAAFYCVINARLPYLTPRFMMALVPLSTALVAWLAHGSIGRTRFAAPAIALNAGALAAGAAIAQGGNARWEYNVPTIVEAVHACPETRVVALYPMVFNAPDSTETPQETRTNHGVTMSGYRQLAREHGFAAIEAPNGQPIALALHCPTILWMEHNFFRPHVSALDLLTAAGIVIPSGRHPDIQYRKVGSHFLVIVTPKP